jgi:hypothetical protein
MSAKDSDKHQWSDPKDYGLPYVDIKPIRSKAKEADAVIEKVVSEAEVNPEVKPVVSAPLVAQTVANPASDEKSEGNNPAKGIPYASRSTGKEAKSSSSWVWAVVVIGLGIVSVIVWQIQSQLNSTKSEPVFEAVENSDEVSPVFLEDSLPKSTLTDQNQELVNQDSIVSINNSNPNNSKPAQTGTTIAPTATGNLIRIESKAERPQYFIIVGSLPNEKLAIEEAAVYFGRSPEIYLILPYDGGTNYRLAIGKFGSFKTAAEELEKIKSQYTEALWILKY